MSFLWEVVTQAIEFLLQADFWPVLRLTLVVTLSATLLALLLGIPLGIWTGERNTKSSRLMLVLLNTGMGMPPVLAGLLVLLVLWGDGPLGGFRLLFTPVAMVFVQVLLALPIIAGIVAGAVRSLPSVALEHIASLKLSGRQERRLKLSEVRPAVITGVAAAFGRVISEVGAVLIMGGNIKGETRVLTTAIVQESRQGNLGAALGFGLVLFLLAISINVWLTWFQLREPVK